MDPLLVPAQMGPDPVGQAFRGFDPVLALFGSAVGAFLSTLIVGGLAVAFVPDYVERLTERMGENTANSFAWGLFVFIAAFVVFVLLAITIIGLLAAIPLAVVLGVAIAVGTALGYLAIGLQVVGREDGWLKPLLLGAGLAGVLTLVPVLGGLLSFVVSCVGFGAMFADWAA